MFCHKKINKLIEKYNKLCTTPHSHTHTPNYSHSLTDSRVSYCSSIYMVIGRRNYYVWHTKLSFFACTRFSMTHGIFHVYVWEWKQKARSAVVVTKQGRESLLFTGARVDITKNFSTSLIDNWMEDNNTL